MKRCVVKLDAKKGAKKVERWNTIAASAAKQSGRGIVPEVMSVKTYKEALEMAKDLDVVLVPYECAEDVYKRQVLRYKNKKRRIFINFD